MDRIDRLERSWIIYRLKKLFKSAAFFGAALVVGALAVYFLLRGALAVGESNAQAATEEQTTVVMVEPPAQTTQAQPPSTPAASDPKPVETERPKPEQTPVAQPKPKMNITPNFDFAGEVDRRVAASIAASRTQPQATTPPPQQPPQTAPVQSATATTGVSFQRVGGIKELEAAFNKQPSYSKAADIAEYYLKQDDYKNAYDWALKANELNQNDERSWAVFAEASYKMGSKDRAVNALRGYLGVRSSDRLSRLLNKIELDGGAQ
ncbi:MAG: hypothetical protein LBC09_07220 [Helicobacteraceae bacterium]|jgi:tetratricopeptide (TPR) repeat protein|nr:hypothetical protein [Helicobacteraceae bacterium]